MAKSHVNHAYYSETDSCTSSSDIENDLEWVESIGSKGELFYIKTADNIFSSSNKYSRLSEGPLSVSLENGNSTSGESQEILEATLNIDQSYAVKYSRKFALWESVLGIFVMDNTDLIAQEDVNSQRIVVRGFTTNGPAAQCGKIRAGDILLQINGIDVRMNNLNQVLGVVAPSRKASVKFTRKKIPNFHFQNGRNPVLSIRMLNKDIPNGHNLVLYLKGDIESENYNADGVSYQYPEKATKLTSLSGMFITLVQTVHDVTESFPQSSTLLVEEQLVNIAYHVEGKDVLIFGTENKNLSSNEVSHILANVVRLLTFQYQTLEMAFVLKENKYTLDCFFNNLFQRVSLERKDSMGLIECLQVVPCFPLNDDVQIHIDCSLTELESSDLDSLCEGLSNNQRLYSIQGSCLFYKGLLCLNHLPKEDLLDLFLFNQYHQLLHLTMGEKVEEIVIWQEVFPTRRTQNQEEETSNEEYKEIEGRYFLLIVAQKNTLIALLLDSLDFTKKAPLHPPPPRFYIEQTKDVLDAINNPELLALIEKCYEIPNLSELTSGDSVTNKNKEKKILPIFNLSRSPSRQTITSRDSMGLRSLSHGSLLSPGRSKLEILPKKPFKDGEKQQLITQNSSMNSSPESTSRDTMSRTSGLTSSTSDADSRASSEDICHSLKLRQNISGSFDLSSLHTELDDIEIDGTSNKLLTGSGNALFHYMNLNHLNGVLISPTEQVCLWGGPVQSQIMKLFYKTAADIHLVFTNTHKAKEKCKNNDSNKFATDRFLAPVREQGVLFHVNSNDAVNGNSNSKRANKLSFWVIGRIFTTPEAREVYVCFQDSTPQNTVELAFKLNFGSFL